MSILIPKFRGLARPGLGDILKLRGWCKAECWDPNGNLKGVRETENLVVNTGKDEILVNGAGTWYVGLKDTGTPLAADTMASHTSWATISPYSTSPNPAWTEDGTGSDQKISNSSSPASFAINATDEIFGAFLTDNSTVDAATGLLVAVADFSASQNVNNGDTLNVTYEISA